MKYVRWTLMIAYAGLIFYLSSRTWEGLPSFPLADKGLHAFLYFGLGALVFWALRTTRLRTNPFIYHIAFLCAALYGLSDETHQLFVPGREFSLFDLLADGVGVAAGIFVASKISTLKNKQRVLI